MQGLLRGVAASDDVCSVAQLTVPDLVIVVPDRAAFRDILNHFDDADEHVDICLDRRRGERRHAPGSSVSERRRRRDRRTLDVSEPLQTTGWVIIPAARRAATTG
jgi:hypothetical protein